MQKICKEKGDRSFDYRPMTFRASVYGHLKSLWFLDLGFDRERMGMGLSSVYFSQSEVRNSPWIMIITPRNFP